MLRLTDYYNQPQNEVIMANWIAAAIKKPNSLHKEMGIKKGKKIPKAKLAKAAKKPGTLGKRARLAEVLGKLRKKTK